MTKAIYSVALYERDEWVLLNIYPVTYDQARNIISKLNKVTITKIVKEIDKDENDIHQDKTIPQHELREEVLV